MGKEDKRFEQKAEETEVTHIPKENQKRIEEMREKMKNKKSK